jgi:diphthamide biosynthesis protein 7
MAKPSESPEWSENITLQCKTVLDLPPSCLEFVPKPSEAANASPHLDESYHEYFVVGTYYLEKEEITQMDSGDVEQEEEKSTTASKPQSKNGSLILFRYHDGNL